MTGTLGRFMKASQAAGFDALRIRGAVIASKLDELWTGLPPTTSTPTEKMPKFYAGDDPVEHLTRLAAWIDSEISISGNTLGELKEEMIAFRDECGGLALWIEGRL